jgi:DNA helicase-2/ATP-dependent DNA helicase PcrA
MPTDLPVRTSPFPTPTEGNRAGEWYLEGLNPQQREAVETLEGPVLVLAGAGVGKTRVLTTRVAHILKTGRAWGNEILAVTFTNKAAAEMLSRVQTLTGLGEGSAWMGTFHSIGSKLLRRHAELVGLKPNFTILDTDDQLRLLKQVLKDENIDEKRWPARLLATQIDSWKNRGLDPAHVPQAESVSFAGGKGNSLYGLYQARLKMLNAVDFGDLLLESLRLLRDNPSLLESYQRRFRHILVDEYQDTNHVQYLWLRLLASAHKNICCVGDDDQSIYGWRGADVENILRFEKDFPGAKIIRLECNYRSTGHILAAASQLIAHNRKRLGKTLFTEADDGEKPVVTGVWDGTEEARDIGSKIESARIAGISLAEIAVLVRASFQMRELEERFLEIGLPYRVIGGPRFYERAEIRDAIAYLRCAIQPDDDLAFERIYNVPKRGIGETTLAALRQHARAKNLPLRAASRDLIERKGLKPKALNALLTLLNDLDRWGMEIDKRSPEEFAQMLIDESGLVAMWRAEKTEEAQGRLENLKELVRSIAEFSSLGEFLEHVSLVVDAAGADSGPRVTIMTLHSAKGLEFDTVFLPGWEEGLFPHPRSLEESGQKGLEEERRLAYVGITRARRHAFIYHAANRRVHGQWQSSVASRFVSELPPDHVEQRESETREHWMPSAPSSFGARLVARPSVTQLSSGAVYAPQGSNSYTGGGVRKAPRGLTAGARVFHLKFGPGTVFAEDGGKLTVDFDHAGRKMVMDSFVEPA